MSPRRTKDGSASVLPETVPAKGHGRRTSKKKRTRKTSKLIDAPLAVASDGTALLNARHLDVDHDPVEAVRALLGEGHEVFVGVAVTDRLRGELLRDIDDAGADIVGRIGGRLRTVRSRR